jgi:Zn-dependent oligopeptidase
MSRLLEQQDHFLELLRTTRKLQRQALLRTIDQSQLKALSEIIHNVIKGSIILSPSDKNRLKKYKKVLSTLVSVAYEWCVTTLRSGLVVPGVGSFFLVRL